MHPEKKMKVGIVIRFVLEIYTLSTYSDVVSLLCVNHKYGIHICRQSREIAENRIICMELK